MSALAFAAGFVFLLLQQRKSRLATLSMDIAPLYPKHPQTYTIYVPQGEFQAATAGNLMQALLHIEPQLTFQIGATPERIAWQVVDVRGTARAQSVMDTIRSHLAEAVVMVNEPEAEATKDTSPVYRQHLFFQLANEYVAPIAFAEMLKTDDPLISLTRRMDFLRQEYGERLVYTLMVVAPSALAKKRAGERLKEGVIYPTSSVPTERNTQDRLHGLDEALLEKKLSGTLYHAFLCVTVESREKARLEELSQVVSDVSRFGIAAHNQINFCKRTSADNLVPSSSPLLTHLITALFADATTPQATWRQCLLVLHPLELSSLWHLPDERFVAEKIAWIKAKVPDAVTTGGNNHVCLGVAAGVGLEQKVYLSVQDRAFHHAVMGKTGVGKSTLLHNLIHQDIAAGRGVAVIDPHGKLIDDVLTASIPQARGKDVVLLKLGNSERPVPLNPFRIPPGVSSDTAFMLIYWTFRKLYESIWRDRMDYVFRNVLQTLLTDPEATPRDISRILLNPEYRDRIVEGLSEDSWSLKEFWSWYEAQPKSEQMEIASPILTRTSAFLGNKAVELMTCHPHTIDIAALIREQKIVLVNLSGDAIHTEVGTLGAILLSQFFVAAQSLGYLPDKTPPRIYLYVDEVERMMTTPLPEMFALSRKFGISLTLANQYMKQLSSETLEGMLGNVGTHFIFEVGESDSRHLARLFDPEITREELLKLGTYQMAVAMRAEGKRMPPFIVKTLPPPAKASRPVTQPIPRLYAPLSAQEVSTWLAARYRVEKPKKPETKPSGDGLTDYD